MCEVCGVLQDKWIFDCISLSSCNEVKEIGLSSRGIMRFLRVRGMSLVERIYVVSALFCMVLALKSGQAVAEGSASSERTEVAVGHYARARSLLIEALEEFETGRRIARPDLLVDPDAWKLSVTSRAEELDKILSPQPRLTRAGTRFNANNKIIGGVPISSKAVSVNKSAQKARGAAVGIDNAEPGVIQEREPNVIESANLSNKHRGSGSHSLLSKMAGSKKRSSSDNCTSDRGLPGKLQGALSQSEFSGEVKEDNRPKSDESAIHTESQLNSRGGISSLEQENEPVVSAKKNKQDVSVNGAQHSNKESKSSTVPEATSTTDLKEVDPSVAGMVEKVIEDRIKKLNEEQAAEASKKVPSKKTVDGLFEQYSE